LPWCLAVESGGAVEFVLDRGAALLLTDDCQLDKRTSRAAKPKVSRLQFAPLRDLAAMKLEDDTIRRLRAGEINPPEAMYIDLGDGQECVALLGEAYTIPASYFALECQDFTGHFEADIEDPVHVVPRRADTRDLTMEPHELLLMQQKMALFWLHAELP